MLFKLSKTMGSVDVFVPHAPCLHPPVSWARCAGYYSFLFSFFLHVNPCGTWLHFNCFLSQYFASKYQPKIRTILPQSFSFNAEWILCLHSICFLCWVGNRYFEAFVLPSANPFGDIGSVYPTISIMVIGPWVPILRKRWCGLIYVYCLPRWLLICGL